MKKTMLLILAIAGLIYFTGSPDLMGQKAKNEKIVTVKAKAMEKTKGVNPNIKEAITTVDKEVKAPPDRGGEKTKGVLCEIKFENWTGYTVEVYVDGYYQGTIGAYGDAVYRGIAGYTTIYCVTVGRTYEWAAKGDCSEYYIYKLTRDTAIN